MRSIGSPPAPSGYRHPAYAQSLAEFGAPRFLSRSGGLILERPIGKFMFRDAMGCYPLFSCECWSELNADLDDLAKDLVCLTLITDPFGKYTEDNLRTCFKDKMIPFKQHYVADLRRPPDEYVSKHHRYYARRSQLKVERVSHPIEFLDEWYTLYANLIERHRLTGIKAFSRDAFSLQLAVPGIVMLRAIHDDKTVGAHLWYKQDNVIHSHLAASSPLGYDLMTAYALYSAALEMFAGEADWINFGAAAGAASDGATGLANFKKGWASETRTAYLCGRILDKQRYDQAVIAANAPNNAYFPAYRYRELL